METKALIYKIQDYKETSKLLFVYTKEGKFTLVAKGAKNYKSNYRSLDYLTMISTNINNAKSMQTLKQYTLIDSYERIKNDFGPLFYVGHILKSIELIFDEDLNERLFNLIEWILSFNDLELACLTLYIKLTYALGYELTFYKDYDGFSLKNGKTVYKEQRDLNKEETFFLHKLYYLKEEETVAYDIKQALKQFIKKYYLYHMDYDIKI